MSSARPILCNYEVSLYTRIIIHILTGNEVTSVGLFPRGTLSDQKRDLFRPLFKVSVFVFVNVF